LDYLVRFLAAGGAWFVAPLVVPPSAERRGLYTLTLLTTGGLFVYVATVGGDFMGLHRFLVPILPLLALYAGETLARLPTRRPAPPAPVALLFLASFAAVSARASYRAVTLVRDDPPGSGIDMPAYLRKFADDRALIGRWMKPYGRPDDVMTVGGAGAQV